LKAKGDNAIQLSGKAVHKAFANKNISGWSLPLSDRNAFRDYAMTLDSLYKYYAKPNEDLYHLLRSLGSTTGWEGIFPTSNAGTFMQHGHRRRRRRKMRLEEDPQVLGEKLRT